MGPARGPAVFLLLSAGAAQAALSVSPHSLKLHHEWNRAAAAEDWSNWQRAFEAADANKDGRLEAAEVHTVFVEHHNLVARDEKHHPAGGEAEHSHFEKEFELFVEHHTTKGSSLDHGITWEDFRVLMESHMSKQEEERRVLLEQTRTIF